MGRILATYGPQIGRAWAAKWPLDLVARSHKPLFILENKVRERWTERFWAKYLFNLHLFLRPTAS